MSLSEIVSSFVQNLIRLGPQARALKMLKVILNLHLYMLDVNILLKICHKKY